MRRSLTTLAATMTAAGLLVVATATAAVAQDGGGTTPTTPTTAAGAPSGDREDRPHGLRRAVHRIAARTAAEEIGVSVQELRDAVLGGQTIAAYAEAQGKDPAAVEAAIAAALTAKVDEAVANGRITEARAAKVKDRADEIADRLVSSLPRHLENAPQQ